MATKTYRLKVKKIPLPDDIIYRRPNFPQFGELHLDLLENKNKLKKNPPKPIFVRQEPIKREHMTPSEIEEDLTLEELEKAYTNEEQEEVFSDGEPQEDDFIEKDEKENGEYVQERFVEQEEEEEAEEDRLRREHADLLFKFMVLRRQYPNVDIPEFTDHSDINTMRRVYDQIIRRVSLDSSVENYKQYLVGGFMVLEWVSTNWLGIDLSGFTQAQTKAMNKYDRLLVELGEKNYSTEGSRFPVEVRLIFLIIFQAGLFYVQKAVFSGSGPNLFSNMFGTSSTDKPQKRRTRMRGPTIQPDEINDMRNHKSGSSDEESDDE